ncbi:hypothetical protein BGZ98_005097, partial [Dissophora globulifera]
MANTPAAAAAQQTPHVMIVGGGVAGPLLAIMLTRANISFDVYARAQTVKPLGTTSLMCPNAVMSLNVNILPLFEQLGLYDDIMKISFTNPGMRVLNEIMIELGYRDNDNIKE